MTRETDKRMKQQNARTDVHGKVPLREFDEAAVKAELSQRVGSVNAAVKRLEEAQFVTQEVLNLEFSI